ncbi:MAG: hypothetical protein K8T91_11640 [Planctomycetes bacterium]|nr:hypothetical protein [Planctomycetota bacterium]
MRTHSFSRWLPVTLLAISCFAEWPAPAQAADPAPSKQATAKQADEAREKIWNSPEMLQARVWMEGYFRVAKKYTPEQAAAYREELKNLTAPQMELWLMKFEHDRAVSRAQEAVWEQQRRAGVARDEAMLKQERQALGEANRGANEAAAAEEKAIGQQRQEAERNYAENAAAQNQLYNDYTRPYVPYYYYGGSGPSSVHYHFHR